MTSTNQTAEYKGRKYRLLWIGDTKHGRRARLQFFDGTKDFWVDANLVTTSTTSSRSSTSTENRRERSGRCRDCGGPIVDARHHRAMGGLCGTCAFDEYDM